MKTTLMGVAAVVGMIVGTVGRVDAAPIVLFYSGDLDGRDFLINKKTPGFDSRVYDSFTVPVGENWLVTELFSNNISTGGADTQAYFEIRTGVSAGIGGVLLDSGTLTAAVSATGRNFLGENEFTFRVDIPDRILSAGTYWVAVTPSGLADADAVTTSGANAVGPAIIHNNSFIDSTSLGENFSSAAAFSGDNPADYSFGVIGTPVPEASHVLLAAVGALALAGFARRRFFAAA